MPSVSLFQEEPRDADIGYLNIRAGKHATERDIREALERLWSAYEPYSDLGFRHKFAQQPDAHFWEMYLTVQLLKSGKDVRPRSELRTRDRNRGPDIRIIEEGRTIWIEAVTPESGEASSPDRIPEIVPLSEGGGVQSIPRRQVELRITSALLAKKKAFDEYRRQRIVSADDLCVVAISGAKFRAQSSAVGFPLAVTAVYPLGNPYFVMSAETGDVVGSGFHHSWEIERSVAGPIPRYAFLHDDFSSISGLIWSRSAIGAFLWYPSDLVFIHNLRAISPFPRGWLSWTEECVVDEVDDQATLTIVKREMSAQSPS